MKDLYYNSVSKTLLKYCVCVCVCVCVSHYFKTAFADKDPSLPTSASRAAQNDI